MEWGGWAFSDGFQAPGGRPGDPARVTTDELGEIKARIEASGSSLLLETLEDVLSLDSCVF